MTQTSQYQNNSQLIVVEPAQIEKQFNAQDLTRLNLSPIDIARWKRHYAPEAPEEDFLKFIEKCIAYGVDPRRNRAYLVGRWSKKHRRVVYTFQMSFPGLLSKAQSTGEFEGFTRVEYCNAKGEWRDIWLRTDPKTGKPAGNPYACRVGIYRRGFRVPLEVIVLFDAIAAKDKDGNLIDFWVRMPEHMLEKCTKAKAIREAFEDVAGNIFIPEEMHQADLDNAYVKSIPTIVEEEPEKNGGEEHSQLPPEDRVVESLPPTTPAPSAQDSKPEPDIDNPPSERELKAMFPELRYTYKGEPATQVQILRAFYKDTPNKNIAEMLEREWSLGECQYVFSKIRERQAKLVNV